MPFDKLLHGGDYNPEQWLDRPDILAKDVELMEKAHVNVVTLGVFSWSTIEPQEGEFHLDWLADIIHNLYAHGISTILGHAQRRTPGLAGPEVPRGAPCARRPRARTVQPPPEPLLHFADLPRKSGHHRPQTGRALR